MSPTSTSFFPDVLALLDQDTITFLEKETFVDLIDPDRREADLVVQARVRDHDAAFIIHLEHQAQADAELHRRMFRYFARFHDRYRTPVYPIALCSYQSPRRPAPDAYQLSVAAFPILDFRFRVLQLNTLRWQTFVRHPNPLATALLTRMNVAPRERRQVKLACLSYLAGQPLAPARRRMLAAFVGIYLKLSPADEQALQRELLVHYPNQEERVMELLTDWEVRERLRIVLRQLHRKLGGIPAAAQAAVEQLNAEQLNELKEAHTCIGPPPGVPGSSAIGLAGSKACTNLRMRMARTPQPTSRSARRTHMLVTFRRETTYRAGAAP